MVVVTFLDYGAGNVRSVRNAVSSLGYSIRDVTSVEDINQAEILLFPGVGNFEQAMKFLNENNYVDALGRYIQSNKIYLGICLGMQTLFDSSEECPGVRGLSIIPGTVSKFPCDHMSVPHIGWNGLNPKKNSTVFNFLKGEIHQVQLYFVHSFRAVPTNENSEWVLTTTNYGNEEFVSSIHKGNVMATQFHPEKSGEVGLSIIRGFLEMATSSENNYLKTIVQQPTLLSKRIVACLDVRTNDRGDLVVTKGDQYDVRQEGEVRNLGKPVDLCSRYYNEGADEIVFLNICSFRACPLDDIPMLEVLRRASEKVFVPLTVGGGIRGFIDNQNQQHSALDVASLYFRAGADKVSIGSDAVLAAEEYLSNGKVLNGKSSIEIISNVYGRQAVVVSIDPRRVYVENDTCTPHHVISLTTPGPNGEKLCWYQATIKGGREGRNIDAIELAKACEALGAGEILLNCVDMDGQKNGFDHDLIQAVKNHITIPVIASSGAGKDSHFTNVFRETNCDAALAAGIFHRGEISISQVKKHLHLNQINVRRIQ